MSDFDRTIFFLSEVIPYLFWMAHFVCTIVLLIRWAVLRTARSKDRIIRPDKHRYAAVTYPKSFKVLALIVIGGYLVILFPAIAVAIILATSEYDPTIPGAVFALVGLGVVVLIGMSKFGHDEEYATVDTRGLTIQYRDGETKTYGMAGYNGYIVQTKYQPFRLEYLKKDGLKDYISLPFLSERDAVLVGKDLINIRDYGCLEPDKTAAMTEPVVETADEKTEYRKRLELVLNHIPVEKKEQIMQLNDTGYKHDALRECQRASGEGLRVAADLFSDYLSLPLMKYFTCRIYVKNVSGVLISEAFKKYNEIYTDPDRCIIASEGDADVYWHYIELAPNPDRPEDFSYTEFMNVLIWLSDLTLDIFAYAKPNGTYKPSGNEIIDRIGAWSNTMPFYAEPNVNDQLKESVTGIMNSMNFKYVVPRLTVYYTGGYPADFSLKDHIYDKRRVNV